MKYLEVPLSQGRVALIDPSDDALVNQHRWHYTKRGIAAADIVVEGKKKKVGMHKLITGTIGKGYAGVVDHINGNPIDNRRSNLRVCTQSENARNRHKVNGNSKYQGVHFEQWSNRWAASITVNYKTKKIGRFDTELEAHQARKQFELDNGLSSPLTNITEEK